MADVTLTSSVTRDSFNAGDTWVGTLTLLQNRWAADVVQRGDAWRNSETDNTFTVIHAAQKAFKPVINGSPGGAASSSAVTALQTLASSLADRLSTAEATLTSLASVPGTLSTLSTTVSSLSTTVGALQTSSADYAGDIETLEDAVAARDRYELTQSITSPGAIAVGSAYNVRVNLSTTGIIKVRNDDFKIRNTGVTTVILHNNDDEEIARLAPLMTAETHYLNSVLVADIN